jgi:hypothetical protein
VSWSDSEARTGPHEIGLIAKIAARNDDEAARRLYRKYRMELFRFGVHVLRDRGLAEEMVQETFIKFCQQAKNYDLLTELRARLGQVSGQAGISGANVCRHDHWRRSTAGVVRSGGAAVRFA